jgi:hypothetical protein
MAPLAPFGLKNLLRFLHQPGVDARLPFKFGSPHPSVAVCRVDGRYQLRELVEDRAASHAFATERFAKGESFMPEHVTQFMLPTGTVHAEGADLESFCRALEGLRWPSHW